MTGDGLAGYEKNAEYGRLIATCSVRYIPIPWMLKDPAGLFAAQLAAPSAMKLGGGDEVILPEEAPDALPKVLMDRLMAL